MLFLMSVYLGNPIKIFYVDESNVMHSILVYDQGDEAMIDLNSFNI